MTRLSEALLGHLALRIDDITKARGLRSPDIHANLDGVVDCVIVLGTFPIKRMKFMSWVSSRGISRDRKPGC